MHHHARMCTGYGVCSKYPLAAARIHTHNTASTETASPKGGPEGRRGPDSANDRGQTAKGGLVTVRCLWWGYAQRTSRIVILRQADLT